MDPDAVDLAGAVMGVVDRNQALGPDGVGEGQLVVGLRSPNLRSNGFSLVRRVFEDDLDNHIRTLIEPSVIYSPAVLTAVATGKVVSAAHITGGGLAENLERALPPHLGVSIDTASWKVPDVFHLVASRGISVEHMYRTFNMGVGFCLIAYPDGVEDVLEAVSEHSPSVVGRVTSDPGIRLQ